MPQDYYFSKVVAKRHKRLILHFNTIIAKLSKDLQLDLQTKQYVLRRLHHEGPAFVTKILPKFSKYALTCIEHGELVDCRGKSSPLTCFELKGKAPRFMRGYLEEAIAGNPASLFCIRQLCDYAYKLCYKQSPAEKRDAELKYLSIEAEIESPKTPLDWKFIDECRKTFERLFPELMQTDLSHVFSNNRPRSGPGAFAYSNVILKRDEYMEIWKKKPDSKIGTACKSMEPHQGFFKPYQTSDTKVNLLKGTLRTCEVRFVPKDSRGPRTISKEPYHTLLGQMAFNDYMAGYLERKSDKRIIFSDQTIHRGLAKEASNRRNRVTADLKEASDRMTFSVVSHITQNAPLYREANKRLRSTHVKLPSGTFRLQKYANMGSGLCFPTLALIVYVTTVTAISTNASFQRKAAKEVYVYGDDLIYDSRYHAQVVHGLERVGLKVNLDKTFIHGHFRESCGGDYLAGVDVTPVRLRLSNASIPMISECRNGVVPISDDMGTLALEKHCRELIDQGLETLAHYYYRLIASKLGSLPLVSRTSPALGVYNPYKVVVCKDVTAFTPEVVKVRSDVVCPYKGIAASIKSPDGLGDDWCLTTLRRKFVLKRRLVSSAANCAYGLT